MSKLIGRKPIEVNINSPKEGYIPVFNESTRLWETKDYNTLLTGSNTFNGDQTISGSLFISGNVFAKNLSGVVSGSTQVTGALDFRYVLVGDITQTTWDNIALKPGGLVSGSQQLTGSYDTRYVLSGSITQTTWDNIAAKPSGIVSGSSQLDNTIINGLSGSFTGSFRGDGSNLDGLVGVGSGVRINSGSSFMGTAGTLLFSGSGIGITVNNSTASIEFRGIATGTGVAMDTVNFSQLSQSFAAYTWSFLHNLDNAHPAVTVYDENNQVIQPLRIEAMTTASMDIVFSTARRGYAVASMGGVSTQGTSKRLEVTTPSDTWVFQHNIGDKYPVIEVFATNGDVIIPSRISAVDSGQMIIYFPYPTTGTVVASVGGGLPSISSSYEGYTLQVQGGHATWQSIVSASVSNAVSSSYVTYANIANKPTLVSGSSQITLSSTTGYSTLDNRVVSLESWSSSLDTSFATDQQLSSSLATITGSINSLSSSVATSFSASNASITSLSSSVASVTGDFSSSVATSFSQSNASLTSLSSSVYSSDNNQNGRLNNLESKSASVDISVSSINSFTSSTSPRLSNLESKSASVDISVSNINSFTSSATGRLSNLESKSASVDISVSNINSFSSSTLSHLTNIESKSASVDTSISNINYYTSSLKTALSVSGQDVTINGNLLIAGTSSVINSTTLNISSSIIELNYGGTAIKGGIYIKDGTGGSLVSGSILWDGSNDYWIAGKSGSESKVLLAGGDGVVSGSSQILNGSGVWSGSAQLPSGIISSSAQTIANLPTGVVSGSIQVDVRNTTGITTIATTGSNIFTGKQSISSSFELSDSATTFQIVGNSFGQTYLQSLNGALVFNPGYGGVEIVGVNNRFTAGDAYITNLYASNGVISGSSQLTSSYDTRYVISGSITQTTWDNIASKPSGIVSGSSQLTSSYDTRYVVSGSITQTTWDNIASKPSGIVSGAAQITSSLDLRYLEVGDNISTMVGYGTLALTGSNNFIGTQTITGSLSISGSLILDNANIDTSRYLHYQSVASTTWTVNHNLEYDYPSVTIYDNTNKVIIPDEITRISNNQLTITFASAESGNAHVSVGGISNLSGDRYLYTQSTTASVWTITHGLNYKYVNVNIYDSSDEMLLPQIVKATDANTTTLTFATPTSGHAIISKGGPRAMNGLNDLGNGSYQFTGSLVVTGEVDAQNFNTTSDIRLKTNLELIENSLDKVEKLNGYTFDWVENYNNEGVKQIGMIAQEVYAVQPELVTKKEIFIGNTYEEVMLLDYSKVTSLLIGAVKELSEKVKQLENKIGQ